MAEQPLRIAKTGVPMLMTLSRASRYLKAELGVSASPVSLWRWAKKGHRGVKLETRAMGSKIYTCAAWLDRFGAECGKLGIQNRRGIIAAMPTEEEIEAKLEELRIGGG